MRANSVLRRIVAFASIVTSPVLHEKRKKLPSPSFSLSTGKVAPCDVQAGIAQRTRLPDEGEAAASPLPWFVAERRNLNLERMRMLRRSGVRQPNRCTIRPPACKTLVVLCTCFAGKRCLGLAEASAGISWCVKLFWLQNSVWWNRGAGTATNNSTNSAGKSRKTETQT